MKDPGKASEIGEILGSAAVSGKPKAALSKNPDGITFFLTGRV